MLYLTYTNKTKEYEDRIDETNKKLLEKIEKENKCVTEKEDKSNKENKRIKTNKNSNPFESNNSKINPFVTPKKLGYDLIKRENAFEYFYTLLENSHISSDVNKVQTYTQYCDKVCDYFKEEYYRYKVNMEEFEMGYTFRYFNDWIIEK